MLMAAAVPACLGYCLKGNPTCHVGRAVKVLGGVSAITAAWPSAATRLVIPSLITCTECYI